MLPTLRRVSHWALLGGGLSCAVACGHPKEAEDPHVVESGGLTPTEQPAPVVESVDTPLTELERAKVVKVIDDGLGTFLQGVELEASLVDGKFEGFRIVSFRVPADWRGVGLMVGDVVTSINDLPIERPEQAHAAFVSLRTAKALEIAYLRGGKPMRISFPIVGEAPPATEAPSPDGAAAEEPASISVTGTPSKEKAKAESDRKK